jgi:hypothetical protein
MAKAIESLDLYPGESITLRVAGSVELSVRIYTDARGRCFIMGPLNKNQRIFALTTKGITRARGMEKRIGASAEDPR